MPDGSNSNLLSSKSSFLSRKWADLSENDLVFEGHRWRLFPVWWPYKSLSLYVLKSHKSFTYVSFNVFSASSKSLIINVLQEIVRVSFSAPDASQHCGAFLFVDRCWRSSGGWEPRPSQQTNNQPFKNHHVPNLLYRPENRPCRRNVLAGEAAQRNRTCTHSRRGSVWCYHYLPIHQRHRRMIKTAPRI